MNVFVPTKLNFNRLDMYVIMRINICPICYKPFMFDGQNRQGTCKHNAPTVRKYLGSELQEPILLLKNIPRLNIKYA